VAYTAAKKFGTDIMISLFLAGLMLSPSIIGLTEVAPTVSLFGLPMKTVNYSSTLIPVILTIWALKYVEKLSAKIIPDSIKFVFRPFLTILLMIPVMFVVTGPIGGYLGDLLSMLMTTINAKAPWASVIVIGCLAPLLVLTGMHFALIPLVITEFATAGYDNMLFTAFIGMNFSQFGVALAAMLKTKNRSLKELAGSCALTAFLAGVTEPTLYGICLRMKKPLYATWIACIVNAIFCAVVGLKVFSFGAPSFFTMPIYMNPDGTMTNFYLAIAAAAITIVVSFAATWLLGFDDSVYGE
jgi:PTS system beta-glucosides-specific IIC component